MSGRGTALQRLTKIAALAIIFTSAVALGSAQGAKDRSGCVLPSDYQRVLISPATPYQSWQVRAKDKALTWNGIATNETELQRFAGQLAKMPRTAGSAVFQVTESVSCRDRTRVRTALLRSGLCKQGRCWESEGVVKAPVAY